MWESRGTHLAARPHPAHPPPLLFSDDSLMQMSERGGAEQEQKSRGKERRKREKDWAFPTHFDLGRPPTPTEEDRASLGDLPYLAFHHFSPFARSSDSDTTALSLADLQRIY